MSKVKKIEEVPFKNQLDQVINPGDSIVIVTTCCKTTNIKLGRYLGSRTVGNRWSGEPNVKVSVEVDESHDRFVHKEDHDLWSNHVDGVKRPQYTPAHYPGWGKTLTQLQIQENQIAHEKYKIELQAYNVLLEKKKQDYHWVRNPYKRRSTLQRNRIFLAATALNDLITVKRF